jgi:hypothetical protein
MCRNMINFFGRGVLTTSPNLQSGKSSLVGYPRMLIQYIRATVHTCRPFRYPQPEDAPCRGDRDPLITVPCRGDRDPLTTVPCRGDRDSLITVPCRGDRDPFIMVPYRCNKDLLITVPCRGDRDLLVTVPCRGDRDPLCHVTTSLSRVRGSLTSGFLSVQSEVSS